MDENYTKGSDTQGFQPIDQVAGLKEIPSYGGENSGSGDRLGIRHWPGLLGYLEEHFAFSAAILSIVGYVVIASFGAMKTLGQYLGYIFFICGALVFYDADKKDRKWFYSFLTLTLILLTYVIIQNWSQIRSYYFLINKPFGLDITNQVIIPITPEVKNL